MGSIRDVQTYLCRVVERERALALQVVVSPVTECVVGANDDLLFSLSLSRFRDRLTGYNAHAGYHQAA